MQNLTVMFVTAVCFLFLLKLKWPKNKNIYDDFQIFAFVQCIIKQLLDSVFVISRIIKVEVRVISLSRRLITLTSTLIILDITKTESNNCLLLLAACRSHFS